MKVEDNRINKSRTFLELSIGDCFVYDGKCYIKIDSSCSPPNALNLHSNRTDTFNSSTLITPVNAKVVIE